MTNEIQSGANAVRQPATEMPVAYSVKEAVNRLGISRATLYREIAAGRLQAVKCGKRTLITPEAERAWLAALPPASKAGRAKAA